MARTGSSAKPLTYAVSGGFLVGPAHTRQLSNALEAEGLVEADLQTADIIIAHSGGCFFILQTATARLVIFIGMPLAEDLGRTWLKVNWKNLVVSFRVRPFGALAALFFNAYYAVRQPRRNLAMIRQTRYRETKSSGQASHVFIANRDDLWIQSKRLDRLVENRDWAFISMPGLHADIWLHPDSYTPIIKHYARLLA